MAKLSQKQKTLILIITYSLATIILWQFEFGMLLLYPFTILGTWFHEMGHGIMAMLLGGTFHQLEIFSNGSGVATHSGSLFLGPIGNALVAAAGPIGPTIAGATCIVATKNSRLTKYVLYFLSIILLVSGIIWVRSWFGILVVIAFGLVIGFIAVKGKETLQKNTLFFLGVQACLSVYLSIDYLLSDGGFIGDKAMTSDTQVIANSLLLPYWLWGVLIIFISVIMIYNSIRYALK